MEVVEGRFRLHSEKQKVGNVWIIRRVTKYLDIPISMLLEEVSKNYKLVFHLGYDISRDVGRLTQRLEFGEFKVNGNTVIGDIDCVVFHDITPIDFDTIIKVDKMKLKDALDYLKQFNFKPKAIATPFGSVSL